MSNNSSKIKEVFIELYNYSFFHSPSNIRNIDDRFIGREKIQRKLKDILLDTSSKSGAYMVTGYRGMGKTSLVNNVLNEIQGKVKNRDRNLIKFLRIFALLVTSSFINADIFWAKLWFVSLLVGLFFYMVFSNNNRANFNKNSFISSICIIPNTLLRLLYLNNGKSGKYISEGLIQEFFIVILLSCPVYYFNSNYDFSLGDKIMVNVLVFLSYLVIIFTTKNIYATWWRGVLLTLILTFSSLPYTFFE